MNPYKLLKTKPHNTHYMNRYIKFIESCKSTNAVNGEDHHILPKSKDLFPEYKSFRKFAWNKIKLSLRQHYIAHLLLWKTFGGRQAQAFKLMCNRTSKTNSRLYEIAKVFHSDSMKGCNNPNSDGLQAKSAWDKSSQERRTTQSKIMAEVNRRTKSKPKELRIHTCPHCLTAFEKLEHCHQPMKIDMCCSLSCASKRSNARRKLGKGIVL